MEDKKDRFVEVHFIQELDSCEIERIQLVKMDEPLISIPAVMGEDRDRKKGNQLTIKLIPGENTTLSEDGKHLLAAVTGYPTVSMQQYEKVCVVKVDMVPLISVSRDMMKAVMTFFPPPGNVSAITIEEIKGELDKQEIIFGIDTYLIKTSLHRVQEEGQACLRGIVVATGILPVDGENSFLRFEMDIGPIAGKILGDGTIDFRERKMFIGVDEGELIATKIFATKGTPGMDVQGKKLSAYEGKDSTVKVADDAVFLPETGEIKALNAGILTVVSNCIKVSAKQTISGDVDFSTGNIASNDSITISGSILPDFRVKALGDAHVGENVQSGVLVSRGNVVITGGVVGKKSRIRARGDIDIGFVETGKITARGTIVVRKQVYYSRLSAAGDIFCHETSKVIGGILACSGSFSGGEVGAPSSEPAVIAVGIDRKKYKRYQKIKKQLKEFDKKRTRKVIRFGKSKKKDGKIKKVEKKLRSLEEELTSLNLETDIDKNKKYSNVAEIVIHGEIFAGTQLRIGNRRKDVEENCSGVKFFYDIYEKKIAMKSL